MNLTTEYRFTDEQITTLEAAAIAKMEDNGHALISPSGVSIWKGCMGSVVGIHEYRKIAPDNPASVEGTCAHFCLELCLLFNEHPLNITHVGGGKHGVCPDDAWLDDVERWNKRIMATEANDDDTIKMANDCYQWVVNVDFPPEMRQEVGRCYDIIMDYVTQGWTLIPEMKVSLVPYLGHSQCDGTSDVVLFNGTDMIVADLKYGIAIEVNPVENGQMRIYASGAIDYVHRQYGVVIDKLTLVVMQPRINDGVWKAWQTTYAELYPWIMNEVKPASLRSLYAIANPDKATEDWFTPSSSACRWCHRSKTCRPKMKKALADVKQAFAAANVAQKDTLIPAPFDPDSITDEQLAQALDFEPFIKGWFASANKEALVRVKQGRDIGGRKMVMGRTAYKWPTNDRAMAKVMVDMGASPDQIFNVTLKSKNQITQTAMDTIVKKNILSKVIATKGGDVLALSSDTREAVSSVLKAKNEFIKAGVVEK